MERNIQDRIKSAKRISKYILGNLDDTEQRILETWLKEAPSHREQFELACKTAIQTEPENPVADEKEWKEFTQKYKLRHPILQIKPLLKYAVILCLCLSGILLYNQYRSANSTEKPAIAVITDSTQAILTLANGEIISLGTSGQHVIATCSHARIIHQPDRLIYQPADSTNISAPQYNTIYVPRFGEYTLQLTDGTTIRLNSETILRYPVIFSESNREVWLSGEGYFQVTHQENSPFRVHLNQGCVNVLGTTFNISAYPNIPEIRTTLLSGSVCYEKGNQSRVLKPGTQAIVREGTNHIEIKEIDVSTVIAWTKGQFYFKEETLETILNTLSRWYDVNFIYRNEQARKLCFTVETDRFKDISNILALISETGKVHFKQDRKIIIVQ